MRGKSEGNPKTCFVIGPIGASGSEERIHADWLLDEIIAPVFSAHPDFQIIRADKISRPGMIDAQVIGHLLDAELVVADLSYKNPNAFYELGIRHLAQKPVIHMQVEGDEIPFDVKLYRAVVFSLRTPADLRSAREQLGEAVESVLSPDCPIENPVTRARGEINFQKTATDEQNLLLDEIRAIRSTLDNGQKPEETVVRPWGRYSVLARGDGHSVKYLEINPRATMSLQVHHRRSELWFVLAGQVHMRRGDDELDLCENDNAFVVAGTPQRLGNPGVSVAKLIGIEVGQFVE